jgi:hypothetical protein
LQVAAQVDGSKLPVTALVQDKPLTITRLGDSVVVPPQGRSQGIASILRECGGPAIIPGAASTPSVEVPANLILRGKRRWVVLASRPNSSEAFELLKDLSPKFKDAQVFKAANGRFAIVAGPMQVADATRLKARLTREMGAPADMFFSGGQNFVARVEYRQTGRCRVHGTPDRELNVRDGPAGNIVGVLKENQVVLVSDRRMDSNGQPWLAVKDQAQLTGWAFGKYITCDGNTQ